MKLRILTAKKHTRRIIMGSILLFIITLLPSSREPTALETVLARGELKMATRIGPITYYKDGRGPNGFEYLLAKAFAKSLGVNLKVTTTDTLARLFNMLGGPNADFAAATLTVTPYRSNFCQFSQPYAEVEQTILYKRGTLRPKTVADLINNKVVLIADSSHEERFLELKEIHPDLLWERIENVEMVELIEMVNDGSAAFAVVDSTSYDAHRAMYPRAKAAFTITEPQGLAWAFAAHQDDSLVKAANRFFITIKENGYLDELQKRFFSGIENFSVAGSQSFNKFTQKRLPQFEPLFRIIGQKKNIDWHLLAAIAYQESHWNPKAVSPTGVKGMMMLTLVTAAEVGVDDRTDPEQSLRGGAEYFLRVKSRLPKGIKAKDRTWFALAAYNVGLGHLEDARILTQRAGLNPNLWEDVEKHLPLLQKSKYFNTVKHGYARGKEPVLYVQNIRKYLRIIQWNTIEKNRRNTRERHQQKLEPAIWNSRSFLTL